MRTSLGYFRRENMEIFYKYKAFLHGLMFINSEDV